MPVNINTTGSRLKSADINIVGGIRLFKKKKESLAKTSPRIPPASVSSVFSINSCRIKRPRPAPIAARSAISFLREIPADSNRFAMFPQAINNTNPTAPSSSTRKTPIGTKSASGASGLPRGDSRARNCRAGRRGASLYSSCASASIPRAPSTGGRCGPKA